MGRLAVAALVTAALSVALTQPALAGDVLVPLGSWGQGHDLGPHVEGVAATEDGSVAVADRKRHRVVVFDRERERVGRFGAWDPRGIAAIPGGGYLVAEPLRVRRVDEEGRTLGTYPAWDPRGVAVAGDVVLIAEGWSGRILRYGIDGSVLASWDAGLAEPRGLAVAPDGDVYVADAEQWRVERLEPDGDRAGGWDVPHAHGVAVGPDGTVYVTTDRADALRWFSAGGEPQGTITAGLSRPRGVAVDCRGTVTVADNSAFRLSSYGDPSAPPPPCPEEPLPPPPPPPPPTVAAAPAPPAPPEQPRLGATAAATPLSGAVFVGTGEQRRRLTGRAIVPVETQVDATDGSVELVFETAADDADSLGPYQSGVFNDGAFTIHQGRRASLVELRLAGAAPAEGAAQAARRKRRRIWGSARGSFRTTGRHGAATVRGTRWLTEDRASGTFFRVTEGTVLAEAFERDQRRILHAGDSFLARPACASRRRFRIRLRLPVGTPVRSVRVTVGGERVRVRRGARITAPVDLRGRPRGVVKVGIRVVTQAGTVLTGTRRYHTCVGPTRAQGSPEL